jgi:hypothetical protein
MPTFQAQCDPAELQAIATKDADGKLNLLVLNWSDTVTYNVRADLSGFCRAGTPPALSVPEGMPANKATGTIRQFNTEVRDEIVGQTAVEDGVSPFAVPPRSAVLVTYESAAAAGPS